MSNRKAPARPFVIGLVGGVAAGKSHVAETLQSHGAARIDADALGHDVIAKPLIVRRLKQLFGDKIVNASGEVDRAVLAKIVFATNAQGEEARKQLEEAVHPVIHAEAVQQLRALKESPKPPLAVIVDAPLLLEAGWAPMCDAIVFVDTPADVRQRRGEERGWSQQEFLGREAAQMSLENKKRRATHVVDGQLNQVELDAFCIAFLKQIAGNSR